MQKNLIIVENDPVTLALYSRELKDDFTILPSKSEESIWVLLENVNISLIVLEPAKSEWVWRFLTICKSNDKTKDIPVIICTTIDEKKRGLQLGADIFLLKPVYAQVLRQNIERLLQK